MNKPEELGVYWALLEPGYNDIGGWTPVWLITPNMIYSWFDDKDLGYTPIARVAEWGPKLTPPRPAQSMDVAGGGLDTIP